jgi:hypothetical protein
MFKRCSIWKIKLALLLCLLLVLPVTSLSGPAYAQGLGDDDSVDWRELETDYFIIIYAESVIGSGGRNCACGIEEAEFYANFIDEVYTDLVAVFEVELQTPINLRLFPTEKSYYEVNPIAERITGVIAHALNNREEIAIALTRTKNLSREEIINNVRHELTHFFASLLSDGKLNTGFQEGIAQYLEKPNDKTSYDPAVLELAYESSRLLTWAELDTAEQIFRDPQVAYPEALAIASFLIDRYGFAKFVDFIKANATEPGYRSALEVTYGKSPEELEAEWLGYLPEYFEGRWKINALYGYDLSRLKNLVEHGAYTDAETELVEVVDLLKTTDQLETLAEAEALLVQIREGQAAGLLADETRQALLEDDYQTAMAKGLATIKLYETLEYRERIPEIQIYIERAQLGQQALEQLDYGEWLLNTFRFSEAERQIYEATALLQTLGNQTAAQRGIALLNDTAHRKGLLAYGMLAVGMMLLILNGLRRLAYRFSANPLEVEFT